jgi:hypothetical protein
MFALMGLMWVVEIPTATTLRNDQWGCTDVAVIDGRGECIKYERKKK